MYATETVEQFEEIFVLFEEKDDEESDSWWDKLSNELDFLDNTEGSLFGIVQHDDSDFEDEYEECSPAITEEKQSAPKEAIVTMDITPNNGLKAEVLFEVEKICESCLGRKSRAR